MVSVLFRQEKLLYHPPEMTMDEARREAGALGLEVWPDGGGDGGDFRALLAGGETRSNEPSGTVIVFHGNAGWAGDRKHYFEALEPRGFRVLLAEYPGYAGRPGRLGEKSLVGDAVETLRSAHEAFGAPLYVWGESLGSGVAAAVAARVPERIAGVVLLTPWSRLSDLAAHYYPWLPTRLFLRDRYDSIAALESFDGPVAVLLCEEDSIVPRRFGEKLYEHLSEPRGKWVFPGADHNEWPARPTLPWWDEVMEFLTLRSAK